MSLNSVNKMNTFTVSKEVKNKIVNDKFYIRKNGDDITPSELYEILIKNKVGYRATFLNYYINSSTKVVNIDEDNFNKNIIKNLSPKAKEFHLNTLNPKNTEKFSVIANYYKNGIYTSILINLGTKEEPSWSMLPTIIATVETTQFYAQTDKSSASLSKPKRIICNIRNNNKNSNLYKQFITDENGDDIESLDNEKYFACIDMIQDDIKYSLTKLKKYYYETDDLKFFSDKGISDDILETNRVNKNSAAGLAKYVITQRKGNKFLDPIPAKDPSHYYTQLRIPISGQTTEEFWNEYGKMAKTHKFTKQSIHVMAPKSRVYYRYVDTRESDADAVMDFASLFYLSYDKKNKDEFIVNVSRFFDYNLNGENQEMFSKFNEGKSQVLIAGIKINIFVNANSFMISADLKAGKNMFVVRLNNDVFGGENGTEPITDGDRVFKVKKATSE